jgi:host factor-I protein
MEGKSQNIQDVYLNTVRRDKVPVTIFLMSGVKLMGRLRGFDKYSVILEANHQEQLIFKHAISTVTTSKPGGSYSPRRDRDSHRDSHRDVPREAPRDAPRDAPRETPSDSS